MFINTPQKNKLFTLISFVNACCEICEICERFYDLKIRSRGKKLKRQIKAPQFSKPLSLILKAENLNVYKNLIARFYKTKLKLPLYYLVIVLKGSFRYGHIKLMLGDVYKIFISICAFFIIALLI